MNWRNHRAKAVYIFLESEMKQYWLSRWISLPKFTSILLFSVFRSKSNKTKIFNSQTMANRRNEALLYSVEIFLKRNCFWIFLLVQQLKKWFKLYNGWLKLSHFLSESIQEPDIPKWEFRTNKRSFHTNAIKYKFEIQCFWNKVCIFH